jgi:hypothetical protein
MRKRTISVVAIFSVLFLWGCYPDGPTYTEDMDLVVTHHNPDYDFAVKGTYAMPNKIVEITGNLQEGDAPEYIPDGTAKSILDRVAANMESLGWQRVDVSANPDVLLAPAAWETTTIYYYYDYWYWWYGGYYPYYPYYPPVSYAGSYTTGTLLLTIMDPDELSGTGNPVQQWTGAINGILDSKYEASRVLPLVDQMFEQSPYLKTN